MWLSCFEVQLIGCFSFTDTTVFCVLIAVWLDSDHPVGGGDFSKFLDYSSQKAYWQSNPFWTTMKPYFTDFFAEQRNMWQSNNPSTSADIHFNRHNLWKKNTDFSGWFVVTAKIKCSLTYSIPGKQTSAKADPYPWGWTFRGCPRSWLQNSSKGKWISPKTIWKTLQWSTHDKQTETLNNVLHVQKVVA